MSLSNPNGSRGVEEKEVDKWVRLYMEEKWTLSAIAHRFHRAETTVKTQFTKRGIVIQRDRTGKDFVRKGELG